LGDDPKASPNVKGAADMRSSPFEALIFDLGGVIIAHDNAVLYDRLASRCEPGWTGERVGDVVADPAWQTGALPITVLHERLRATAGYDADWKTFAGDWCCHLVLDNSMLGTVRRLANHNRVMIFSNTNAVHWDFAVAASEGALVFLEPYLSHEIGHEKPSARAYQVVAERAGIDPSRTIFFDDLPANVEGARRAGYQAEVFTGEAPLVALLRDRGVRLD
jgi:FMN phosphatase YigB (HAD superfamily)